ncbi:uncharacterized protein LOC128554007 [Mercenaria mercenaria]|uniref:uncharacterized protein LOC128554007 n=1 Tax=Mercenaria mercenaria TaxID=6596 RepID=UPI00234E46FC|nr:uncharacterized protein LOC128554007 [Mercenaria mercenaria]
MNVYTGRVSMEHVLCETCEYTKRQIFVVCRLCNVQMCEECFRHHRKGRLCKEHEFTRKDAKRGYQDRNTCQQHIDVPLNWYCSTHDKVRCGECLFFDGCTSSCQIEKIRDKAVTFKESGEFTALAVEVSKRKKNTEQYINNTEAMKISILERHDKFKNEVEACGDKLVSHIKKLVESMLQEGDEAFHKSKTEICLLEKEYRGIAETISSINNTIQPEGKHPYKHFINSVTSRQKLKHIDEQLLKLEQKKNIKNYEFCQHPKVETAITDCRVLGTVKELTVMGNEQEEEKNKTTLTKIVKESQVPIPQITYLLDPKNDVTTTKFASKFEALLAGRIKVVHTFSSDQCKGNLPIALLCRPQTEREFAEIESILKTVPANMHERVAVIYIHVVNDKASLPIVPTAKKVSEIENIGIILDVMFKDSKMPTSAIYPCKHTDKRSSIEAFVDFVNLVIQRK